jgi:3-hydroxyacyl-[acyl-carrier-protein] dehydratase
LEALAQLTGWLTALSSHYEYWFLLARVYKCNFYGFAFPGDQVELEVSYTDKEGEGEPVYLGLAKVNGRKKVLAEFSGRRVPLADLDDVEARKREFQVLRRSLPLR